MTDLSFPDAFAALTGHDPLPWQVALFERLVNGLDNAPRCCDIPTGLGKTSVIAVWLVALGKHRDKIPRRLAYVVNRRTVVDQTTDEVTKLRRNLADKPALKSLRKEIGTLAVSTLRGQFADNQQWSSDPSRSAVICGTVDMIGSRLLFSGYRLGFKSKPLHAGFLGQDTLLVHDEAHLEPAFQELIEQIESEQQREQSLESNNKSQWPTLRIMALSATTRNSASEGDVETGEGVLGLSNEDREHPVVKKRINAHKNLTLHAIDCRNKQGNERSNSDIQKDVIDGIIDKARSFQDSGRAVLVFVRGVEDVEKIVKSLPDGSTEQLTGTLRGLERDALVTNVVFQRFLPPSNRVPNADLPEGTVYLVCTSAGEVGVNISADHLVCDLSPFDSMAQRFGRVNRFGERNDTQIHVIHPTSLENKGKISELDERRTRTFDLLKKLSGDASPAALGGLDAEARSAAFAPEPRILPASDILFDAWSLTTIRNKMPGRPPVAPYLHGITEWDPPQTEVAWREEVEIVKEDLIDRFPPADLLENYPLKPHELLKERSDRVFKALGAIAKRNRDSPVWLVGDEGAVELFLLKDLVEKDHKDRIKGRTVLLPPSAGGLNGGLLDGKADHDQMAAYDIADRWVDEQGQTLRARVWDGADPPEGFALIRTIDTQPDVEEFESDMEEPEGRLHGRRFWQWYVRPRSAEDVTRASTRPIRLEHHTSDVVTRIRQIVTSLPLDDEVQESLIVAAELHDLGKRRELFQRSIGNPNADDGIWYAKPGKPDDGPRWRPRRISTYRHEFGSLLDILSREMSSDLQTRFDRLSGDMKDLVLHVIAAHHGRARPHFPPDEVIDPASGNAEYAGEHALETFKRYARLQRRYGRWGLAYLESMLRAADWAASAEPSENWEDNI